MRVGQVLYTAQGVDYYTNDTASVREWVVESVMPKTFIANGHHIKHRSLDEPNPPHGLAITKRRALEMEIARQQRRLVDAQRNVDHANLMITQLTMKLAGAQ